MSDKVIRQVYFKRDDAAKEFVWTAPGFGVQVKDIECGESDIITVTVKGHEEDICKLNGAFDSWVRKETARDERDICKEIRRRDAVLANALACREGLIAYLMDNCWIGDDEITEIAEIEDLIDPMIMDLANELSSTRPGPSRAMLDAYMRMVSDIHEGN